MLKAKAQLRIAPHPIGRSDSDFSTLVPARMVAL